MKPVHRRLIAFTLFLSAPMSHGADLWDIYQLANQNDPRFQAASFDYQAEQQKIPIARSELLPNLSAEYAYLRNRDEVSSDQPFVTQGDAEYNSEEYGVILTQPIYNQGKIVGYRQAKSVVEVAKSQFDIARLDLMVRTAVRYFAVLAAQDNLDVATSEKTANARQHDLAKERLEVGLGTVTDLYDAEARLRVAEAGEIRARNLLDDAQRALVEIIGTFPERLAKIKDTQPLNKPQPEDPDDWVRQAMSGNLELAVSQQTEEVARKEVQRQNAGHFPSLDFVVTHDNIDSRGSISGPGGERTFTDAKVQLSIPLLQGGGVVYSARAARYRFEAAQRNTETARRAADRNVRSAYLGVLSNIEQVTALQQAVRASQKAVEAKEEGFAAGIETNIDVLNAQRDLFTAQRDYFRARYDYILNWLKLKQVVGTLNEQDLQRTREWLE